MNNWAEMENQNSMTIKDLKRKKPVPRKREYNVSLLLSFLSGETRNSIGMARLADQPDMPLVKPDKLV